MKLKQAKPLKEFPKINFNKKDISMIFSHLDLQENLKVKISQYSYISHFLNK